MSTDFDVRPYQPGDEEGLVALFGRCFGRETTLAHWRWKMQSCEASYDTMWVAVQGDRHVGQYVGTPVTAWIRGEPSSAIAIFDTMVDPSMRRKGVLTVVGQAAHDHWESSGVQLGFGLPNQQWGSRAAALGWVPLFPLKWLVRVLRPEAILARRSKIPGLKSLSPIGAATRRMLGTSRTNKELSYENVTIAGADFDAIARAWRCTTSTQIARGQEWVQKRYLDCPSADYRVVLAKDTNGPVAYAVYRIIDKEAFQLVITEVILNRADPLLYSSMMNEIERQALELGVETMRSLAVPGKLNHKCLLECGFIEKKEHFTLQCVPFATELKERRGLSDWDFEGGDFDVV